MSGKHALTFQDLVRRGQGAAFVGRTEEQTLFAETLEKPIDDPDRVLIFNLSGQGGMGKSYLARRFAETGRSHGQLVGWTDESERDAVETMRRLASDIGSSYFGTFVDIERKYRQKRQEVEADPEVPESVVEMLGRGAGRGGIRAARHIPALGLAFELLDEGVIGEQMGAMAAFVAKKFANKEDARLVREPLEVLTPAFLEGLERATRDSRVLLFFDTFEAVSSAAESWLYGCLSGRFGPVPPAITVVISGREPLDPNRWSDFHGVTAQLRLEAFEPSEAREYLRKKGIRDPAIADVILSLAGGIPLLLATLAAGSPGRPEDVGDATGTAVERFLKWMPEARLRTIALHGAIPRIVNQDTLGEVLDDDRAAEAFGWLASMPFVLERRHGHVYHDVVRQQMLSHIRAAAPAKWNELHRLLAAYYERAKSLRDADPGWIDDPEWQAAEAEVIYHSYVTERKYRGPAVARVLVALPSHPSFARSLCQSITSAEIDACVPESDRVGRVLTMAVTAFTDGARQDFDELVGSLLSASRAEQLKESVVPARLCQAQLSERAGDSAAAAEFYSQALAHDPNNLGLRLGRAIQRAELEEADGAIADLDAFIEGSGDDPAVSQHGIATLLALRSYLKRQQGDPEGARSDASEAIKRAPKTTAGYIALASILEHEGELVGALQEFDRAGELDPGDHWLLEAAASVADRADTADWKDRQLAALESNSRCEDCWQRFAAALSNRLSPTAAANALMAVSTQDPYAISHRARALRAFGEDDLAANEVRRVLTERDDIPPAWLVLGLIADKNDEPDEAIAAFTRAIALDPGNGLLYWLRGAVHANEGALLAAEADLGRSIELLPGRAASHLRRAYVRALLGRHDEASEDLRQADEIDEAASRSDKEPAKPRHLRASVLTELGRYDEAVEELKRVIEVGNGEPEGHVDLGLNRSYLGDWDAAVATFREVLDRGPSLHAQYNLVAAIARSRGIESARAELECLERLLEAADVEEGPREYALGGIAAMKGLVNEAVDHLRAAIQLLPEAAPWASRDPAWAGVRSHPDVQAVLKQRFAMRGTIAREEGR